MQKEGLREGEAVTPKAKPTPLFTHTFERVRHSADMVRVRWNHTAQVGIILGTGLGKLAVFAGVREFPARVKCASLAWHTLKAAVDAPDTVASTE